MKKNKMIFFIGILTIIVCGSAVAQQVDWTLQTHSKEIYKLESEIMQLTEKGYMPFGIGNFNSQLTTLFVKGPGIKGDLWQLKWYHSSDEIKAGIDGEIAKGFVPFGVSSTSYGFFVFYIRSGWKTEEWSFVQTQANKQSALQSVKAALQGGFIPVGITKVENSYWILVTSYSGAVIDSIGLESYDIDDKLQSNVNTTMRQGYFPYGIMFDTENGVEKLFILYVKFSVE